MLKEKRAGNMDIGGPGGTGSSYSKKNAQLMSSTKDSNTKPIRSYMEGSQLDDNVTMAERKRKQA